MGSRAIDLTTLGFHPITATWFAGRFGEPTEAQRLGWPEILRGRHTLLAAPTGSGKTLAAFLACLDRLVRASVAGQLTDQTEVLYVSPLKALSNDIRRNLETPLAELQATALAAGHDVSAIRAVVRTGDTPASERARMLKRPPHILVTTPESLYLLLTSTRGREILRPVRTVIVDEIHALARDKRGSHLTLSLERLEALIVGSGGPPPLRIGLSATQRPMDQIARFLIGAGRVDAAGQPDCSIVDIGHVRQLDLGVEVPASDLSAVCSNDQWAEIHSRLTELVLAHRSTLIFVNTRRLAERLSHRLTELLGEGAVASHHGSLSRDIRLAAEERLKAGELKAIVATASLELGIDVGYIDLVCQIDSPRSIATFLQRVGRAGHSLGAVPKGRLFPLTRDGLLECLALVRAVKQGRLDAVEIPVAPIDILAQQIVAAVACEEWAEDDLYRCFTRAWPFRDLPRTTFDAVLEMLSQRAVRAKRLGTHLHRDRINNRLRATRGARITALTCGGAIPDNADYRVVTDGDGTFVGTVNEDFAIESMAGDIFLLGNMSWRIRGVRNFEVIVSDAEEAPASIPFWLGEAPGRTIELSGELSDLRVQLADRAGNLNDAVAWTQAECGATESGARQAALYVADQKAALGLVPTRTDIVFERFFDETGGMQLVIHSPYGGRINRAWGLAMRKRFCRSFDFELQASADDNGVVLSLGPQHSFPIEDLFGMLTPANAEHNLTQALLAVPMFTIRWRWNSTRALAVLRHRGGRRVPPQMQRFHADDLLTAVFPLQTACLENRPEDIPIPDHPLVQQTVFDCLHEAMDLDRWLILLQDVREGRVRLIARDTREPSPFSYERLNANPYAFLDDAPLEERRARAVATRRTRAPDGMDDLARLDPEASARVIADAQPVVRDADELHEALLFLGVMPASEGQDWRPLFESLIAAGRAAAVETATGLHLWIAAERWPLVRALYAGVSCAPPLVLPAALNRDVSSEEAATAIVRGRIECQGPITAAALAESVGLPIGVVDLALAALELEGCVLRGRFTPEAIEANGNAVVEWCERGLLARIHRLTLEGLRRQIQAAEPADFLRFVFEHQHLTTASALGGREGLATALRQLHGFESSAGAWEHDLLPARVRDYDPDWLDDLTLGGELAWGRLQPPQSADEERPASGRMSRVVPIALGYRAELGWLLPPNRPDVSPRARGDARSVLEALAEHGALFFHDLIAATGLLQAQLEDALSELSALGLVTADAFASIRGLVSVDRRPVAATRRRHGRAKRGTAGLRSRGGRWSRFPGAAGLRKPPDRTERWARLLLDRYGVVFRDLLARESVAPSWQELAPVYRRLEARGDVRGGRFVSGVAGQQFALPEAVDRLRRIRDAGPTGECVIVSAADPLNLVGIVTTGPRIAANRATTLAFRDGKLIASRQNGDVALHEPVDPDQLADLTRSLTLSAALRHRDQELVAETVGTAS